MKNQDSSGTNKTDNYSFPLAIDSYIKIDENQLGGKNITVWNSTGLIDEFWDRFVLSMPDSSFEQMSLWAKVKAADGWKFQRVVLIQENEIIGGFQLLFQKKKFIGNIGYISKGPLVKYTDQRFLEFILSLIKKYSNHLSINMLLIIPPSILVENAFGFFRKEFLTNKLIHVIEATTVIDLSSKKEQLLRQMLRMRRQNISRAISKSLLLREGNKNELSIFFEIMNKACLRQKVKPNPSSLEIVNLIWDLFSPSGLVKLFFLEKEGEIVSGCLAFLYQETFLPWKVGWSGKYSSSKPNDAMHWNLILWAQENGYKYYDFGSAKVNHAEIILDKKKNISRKVLKSSTFFKLGFGGKLIYLPKSSIYISNKFYRTLYRCYVCINENFFKFYKYIRIKLNL